MESPSDSVTEASNSDFVACWRGAEAVEASHILHMDSYQVELSGKLYGFKWIFKVSFRFLV